MASPLVHIIGADVGDRKWIYWLVMLFTQNHPANLVVEVT